MLWQKEDSSCLYINLFKNSDYYLREKYALNKKKSNVSSLCARTDGNRLYAGNDFEGALTKYNLSIRLAEDSETLSLAYANRAQCYLKMHRYNFCLSDVHLAKEAGYPTNLMTKLQSRERECLKNMDDRIEMQPVISIQPDDLQVNSAVRIEKDDVFGRMLIAKQDINIGDTVLIEEMYIRTVTDCKIDKCNRCGEKNVNFIPCKNCSSVMYCSKTCADNVFHESECDIVLGTMECIDELIFTIRSVVTAINTFSTVDELISFIQKCSSVIYDCTGSDESKYGAFFQLSSGVVSNARILDCLEKAYYVFNAVMSSSKLQNKFGTTATQRFLMHLIVHHYFVLCTNSFGYTTNGAHVREISLNSSYINHSCLPNVGKLSKGNITVCKAILPVRKGEQLFVTYLADNVFRMTSKERNDQLDDSYGFRCKCFLCTNGCMRADALEKDPLFIYVKVNAMKVEENCDIELIRNVIQHCIKFALKYSKMIGTEELYYITETLNALLSKELKYMN
ncbi:SET and MYND domain-containing protein 4-like [Bradysia coprophila]|uniref:SET and MYND domain-containing protein 4-like n=1 Tax=Bradysia coprophila TaxID=38358 RepID=UPI00187D7126|nr:SET and MYND domain-containing protein 4-like [Bradysia coprophila]